MDHGSFRVKQLSIDVPRVLGAEIGHHRRDEFRTRHRHARFILRLRQESAFQPPFPTGDNAVVHGHSRRRHGAHGVRGDAIASGLARDRACQPDDPRLGRGIVTLSDRAFERIGREIHNPAVTRATHHLDRVVAHVPVALQMDPDHLVEIVLRHVPDHALAQHARDIDDEIDLSIGIDTLRDHASGARVIGHRGIIRDSAALKRLDFGDDGIGGLFFRRLATAAEAGIVDDDAGAFFRHQQRDRPADAAPGAGDDSGSSL